MGRPISYEMQMMFVGSSGAFEEAMNTGSGISRLDFIQSYDFSFNIERTPLKQIGSDSFATRQTQLAPDVNLNIQYYLNDGWNDKYIGLDIATGATGNPFDSILSSTGDRNFYISIAQNDGIDQNLQTGIVNSNILAVGNAYITNYEISVAVNQLATVSCSFVGANANVQDYATSKYLPSVNTLVSGQNAQDANKNFALNFVNNSRTERYLPKAKEIFDGGCPYSKCKITPNFQSGGGTSPITFGFFDAIANNFQSMQFSVQFERKALYGFGNNHPYIRKIQRPTVATLALSALIDDFQAENLSKVFHSEGGTQKSMLIEFFNLQDVKKFGLSLQNLTLESYNLGARIGDRVLVETNWSVEVKNGAGADIGMIGSYGTPLLDTTKVNESFAVERLFYQIDAGTSNGLGIDKNGRAWGWGYNGQGRLGDNSITSRLTPVSVQGRVKTFCKISAATNHSLAIDKNGHVWAWGFNVAGRLGDNSIITRLTPVSVKGAVKTFCQISAATNHSLAIDKNGLAWGWGNNTNGRLGDNSVTCRLTPVSIVGLTKTFCKISGGASHSAAIDKNGLAWGWGYNASGRLGNNSDISTRTPVSVRGNRKTFCVISAGGNCSLAIDKNGRAWGWGNNSIGQLGNNSVTSSLTPVSIAGLAKTFCKITINLDTTVPHSLAIDKNGRAWGWGYNGNGQLGDNSITQRLTPVSVAGAAKTFCDISAGTAFSLAIEKNGRAWGWGFNSQGRLGDNSTDYRLTPISVLGATKTFCTIQASYGSNFSFAIDKNGRAWGWGYNANGRLGNNSIASTFTPVSVAGAAKTFCSISTGSSHVMAIDKNGRAWGWGNNSGGQIGDNSFVGQRTPVSVLGAVKTFCAISAGGAHSLAIDKNGRAWGWGFNFQGQVGDNSAICKITPVSVLGATKTFCKISAGSIHSLAIDKNGRAWGWGYSQFGQVGDNSIVTSRLTPVSVQGAAKTFCQISAATNHSLAIDKNGLVWSWGANSVGQLGDNSTSSRLTPVSIAGEVKTFCKISGGNTYSLAIDKNGRAWGWGSNTSGTLGDNSVTSKRTPVSVQGGVKTFCQISAAVTHSIAIDKNGRAWAWGSNSIGQLGDNSVNRLTPVRVCNI